MQKQTTSTVPINLNYNQIGVNLNSNQNSPKNTGFNNQSTFQTTNNSSAKRRQTVMVSHSKTMVTQLSNEEAQTLQDGGGYLKTQGIKSALLKFVQNKLKAIDIGKVQEKLKREKEEKERQDQINKMNKFIGEQISQLSAMELHREQRIDEAVRHIENQLSRKYQKNQLEWLSVSSKHNHIKPYLKQKLIEQLQNPDTELYKATTMKKERRQTRLFSASPVNYTRNRNISKYENSQEKSKIRQKSICIQNTQSSKNFKLNSTASPKKRIMSAVQRSTTMMQSTNFQSEFKLFKVEKSASKIQPFISPSTQAKQAHEDLMKTIQKTKSLPQFINSKQALASGGSLYHNIRDTFDQFVLTCQEVLENEDNRKILYQKGEHMNKKLKFSFANPATKDAVQEILTTQGQITTDDRDVPLMASLRNKIKDNKFDPQVKMKKDLSQTYKTMDSIFKQNKSGIIHDLPPTNIQYYLKSPQQKKFTEKVLVNIWKEQNAKLISQQEQNGEVMGDLWNAKNETQYHKHKKDIRQASTAPWDKVMMGSYTKLYKDQLDIKNYKADLKNDRTLKGINYDQVKEIVASLPTLNQCIDQNYLQKQINSIDQDTIQTIEASIANDIISKYRSDQQHVKNSRFKYLQRKAAQTQDKITSNDQSHQKKEELLNKCKDHAKVVKRFKIVLDGLENGWCSRVKLDESDVGHKLYMRRLEKGQASRPELMMAKGFTSADSFSNKALYEFFLEGEPKKPYKKSYQKQDERVILADEYAGGPRLTPEKRSRKQITPGDLQKAALMIQKYYRLWKAKKLYQQQVQERELQLKKERELTEEEQHLGQTEYYKLHKNIRNSGIQQQSIQKNYSEPRLIKTYGQLLNKADINARDNNKNSALFYAVQNQNLSLIKQLISMGADVNLDCEGNNSALHEAVRLKDVKIIKYLVSQAGANVLQCNKRNECALYYADEELLRHTGLLSYQMMIQKQREVNDLQYKKLHNKSTISSNKSRSTSPYTSSMKVYQNQRDISGQLNLIHGSSLSAGAFVNSNNTNNNSPSPRMMLHTNKGDQQQHQAIDNNISTKNANNIGSNLSKNDKRPSFNVQFNIEKMF
eukprot:403358104